MQQESFTDPARIGGLDGVPTIARDRANRAVLAEATGRLTQRQELLEATGPNTCRAPATSWARTFTGSTAMTMGSGASRSSMA